MAGSVGAFAGDGVGKWAAVAVAPTLGRVPVFVFGDATDRRTQKRSVNGLQKTRWNDVNCRARCRTR